MKRKEEEIEFMELTRKYIRRIFTYSGKTKRESEKESENFRKEKMKLVLLLQK